MDFPKMGHFTRVLDGFGRWFMVIMVFLWSGRNGFIQMISHLSSLTCCSACWLVSCWPMRGRGCWILTNQRPAEGRPDGPGHPSHSDHRPASRGSERRLSRGSESQKSLSSFLTSYSTSICCLTKYLCSVCWWDWEIELVESLDRAKPDRWRAIDKIELEEGSF